MNDHFPLSHVQVVHHGRPTISTGAAKLQTDLVSTLALKILEEVPEVVEVQLAFNDRSVSTFRRKDESADTDR